jgi:thiol-disulfide isomerase/thioredoxin
MMKFWLAAGIVGGMLAPRARAASPPTQPNPVAQALLWQARQYTHVKTIHFQAVAHSTVTTVKGKKETFTQRYEYWGEGIKYRIDFQQSAPKAHFDVLVTDNGRHYRMLNRIPHFLTIEPTHPIYFATPGMQNPILEPLAPLAPYFSWRLQTPHWWWVNLARMARNPQSVFNRCRAVRSCGMTGPGRGLQGCILGAVNGTPAQVRFTIGGGMPHPLVTGWTAKQFRYPGAYIRLSRINYRTFQLPSGRKIFLPVAIEKTGISRPIGPWRGLFTENIVISHISIDKPIPAGKFTIDCVRTSGSLATESQWRTPDGKSVIDIKRYSGIVLDQGRKVKVNVTDQVRKVKLRGGRTITGRIVWPAGSRPPAGTQYSLAAQLNFHQPPIPFPGNWFTLSRSRRKVWMKHWLKTAAGRFYRAHEGNLIPISIGPHGTFLVPHVPPGKYDFYCFAHNAKSWRLPDLALATACVTVPPAAVGVKPTPIDIGAIPMFRLNNPQDGGVAPPFTLRKLAGRGTLSLSQFRGKFVLLDFWASWCEFCRALTPRLKRIYDRFGKSGKLVIISITYDTHLKWARKYVAAKKIPWLQAVAGSGLRRHSIADDYPSAIPQLYLIGPNGKFISTNLYETGGIESIIARAIQENGAPRRRRQKTGAASGG